MTSSSHLPTDGPPRKPLIDKPIAIALALLAVLAIVTVVVVINSSGDDDSTASGGSTTSSSAPSGGSGSAPGTDPSAGPSSSGSDESGPDEAGTGSFPNADLEVVSTPLGISYGYPKNGPYFTAAGWDGPVDAAFRNLTVPSAVAYQACPESPGYDFVAGAVPSDSTDLASAAQLVRQQLAENLFEEPVPLNDADISDQQTATGIPGKLATATLELGDPDDCGNTEVRIGSFAVQNAAGQTVVMFVSFRRDGEYEVPVDALQKAGTAVLFSVRHS